MIPIVLLAAWVFQPTVAERATDDGLVTGRDSGGVADD